MKSLSEMTDDEILENMKRIELRNDKLRGSSGEGWMRLNNELRRREKSELKESSWVSIARSALSEQMDMLKSVALRKIQEKNIDSSWPDKSNPGVPLDSYKNGPHLLAETRGWVDDYCLIWCAPEKLWTDIFGNRMGAKDVAYLKYIGPYVRPSF